MKEFRQKIKYGKNAEKPILFIVWPEMFMEQYFSEFQATLRNYNEMFDVYYCKDVDHANRYFHAKTMPKEIPQLYIIDPKAKKEIKTLEGLSKELSVGEKDDFYFKKF